MLNFVADFSEYVRSLLEYVLFYNLSILSPSLLHLSIVGGLASAHGPDQVQPIVD